MNLIHELDVGEELLRLGAEEDRVCGDTVFPKCLLELGPDGVVASLILHLGARAVVAMENDVIDTVAPATIYISPSYRRGKGCHGP